MTFEEMNKCIEEYCNGIKREAIVEYSRKVIDTVQKVKRADNCAVVGKGTVYQILEDVFEEMYGKKDSNLFDTHERQKEAECDSVHDKVNCICKEVEKELLEKGICSEVKYQFSVYSCNPTVAFILKKEGHYYSFNYGIDRLFNEGKDVKGAVKIIIKSVVRFFESMRVDYSVSNAEAICRACNGALKRLRKVFNKKGRDDKREINYNNWVGCTKVGKTISFEFWREQSWGYRNTSGGASKGANYLNFEEDNFGDYKVDKYKKITEDDAKLIEDYMVQEGIKFGKEHEYEVNEDSEGWEEKRKDGKEGKKEEKCKDVRERLL